MNTDAAGDQERAGKRAPEVASFDEVRAIALGEMASITDPGFPLARRALARVLDAAASDLARTIVELDRDVGRSTLREASLRMLHRYAVAARLDPGPKGGRPTPLEALGRAGAARPVPPEGPLLIVSNHPGLYDALTLFAAIDREDMLTLAARRPLLDALPGIRGRLIAIEPGIEGAIALRRAVQHLRGGGALLHFPAGQIEPDPRVAPPGVPLLGAWKAGLGPLLATALRVTPALRVMPALVSGVVSRRALGLARLFQGKNALTGALAPFFQTSFPGFDDIDVRVRFGEPSAATPDAVDRLRAELVAMAASARESA